MQVSGVTPCVWVCEVSKMTRARWQCVSCFLLMWRFQYLNTWCTRKQKSQQRLSHVTCCRLS